MSQPLSTDSISELGTQTHYSDDGAREVVLVGVDATAVGRDNRYPPPSPYSGELDALMRRGYFNHRDEIVIQLPRRSDEYPEIDEKSELEDVCWDNDTIHAYYPTGDQEAIRISWLYTTDDWELETIEFDDYLGEIETKHPSHVWKNRRGGM